MHESLRRRSPRLFLSPPKSHQLALTLHDNSRSDPVLESLDNDSHYTPQPLKVHHPKTTKLLLLKSPSSSPVRRSPRFNGVVQSGNCNGSASTLSSKSNGKTMRSPESRKLALSLSSDSAVNGGKRKRELVDRESVRRSPRFSASKSEMSVKIDVKLGKKSPLKLIESPRLLLLPGNLGEIEEDKVLRRSPRVSASNSEEVVEIGGKSGKKAALKLVKSVLSDRKSEVKSPSVEKLGKIKDDQVMRRSPRFLGSESEIIVGIEVKLGKKTPLKLIKSVECEENEGELGTDSPSLVSPENLGKMEEDRVLRRSPRGLPSSLAVDDERDEFEFGFSLKKAKKKKNKAPKVEPKASQVKVKVCGRREDCFFVGEPVSEEEALEKWGWRYKLKGEGTQKHIGRIVELFQTTEGEEYFRAQWFYKPEDTVMNEAAKFHDKKRIFYSCIMNDNVLACIISKLKVIQVSSQLNLNSSSVEPSDFYYDMEYCLEYSTFRNLPRENSIEGCVLQPLGCNESALSLTSSPVVENTSICETYSGELSMLDLYAGCGAMSTGLCIGAGLSGVNLVTRWAIDADSLACESLKLNHSNVQVKNETADDFLELLKHWESLCKKFVIEGTQKSFPSTQEVSELAEVHLDAQPDSDNAADELEVLSLVDISYGDADGSGKQGLKFKVRWKGFGPSDDTWEPIEGLSNCQELIQEFVINGFKNKILPLPGDVDVICGGPPCQGISGYNRFRSVDAPLTDERNRQLVVFMDIVEYLKPKFVLMENVMDILRFDKGSLGRYALSRLVHMNYQARVGIIAAGSYGLPQFRLRVFFWGALPSEELPQFPLPTHDVVVRYWPPLEFERNVVAYDEGAQPPELEDAVFLGDAISDLPTVTNYESSDEMPYSRPPETEFQKYIRSTKYDMICSASKAEEALLYDHRPHQLFEDDYIRVCHIPQRKGANFRDLPGVIVEDDNVVRRDPMLETVMLPSGRPMVPEYAFTFEQGKSKRPFARLWWDETMPTIVTYPNCHSQAVLHPEQDRVLTVRECARLQGFPDNYRFCGTVKKRYRQVGNAVAIPVAKALGYALGMASQKLTDKEPLLTLPPKFAYSSHL
uniref:Cytosine-specific methyltransferase n=1 Tax=Chenopodium quinoa TaxID=63459 RepID=A0A803LTS4_CHEQI